MTCGSNRAAVDDARRRKALAGRVGDLSARFTGDLGRAALGGTDRIRGNRDAGNAASCCGKCKTDASVHLASWIGRQAARLAG
jgi:hypothetical protein